jgi:acetylornithine deacetylase/succinyl-diaminopimelate desuccinylase-like protein
LAVEALLATEKTLPVNVKFFFEGQEEIGSPQLSAFVARHKEKFACNLVVSAASRGRAATCTADSMAAYCKIRLKR